jgi:hypothetical protein
VAGQKLRLPKSQPHRLLDPTFDRLDTVVERQTFEPRAKNGPEVDATGTWSGESKVDA